jgi:hypothetical protein
MNRVEFENALMSTIVDYISDQVILRYMDACKKATVLFTGALIGYGDAVAALRELKEDGWQLTAVLSKAAAEVITEERIQKDICPDVIYVEGAPVDGRKIVDENALVIIPTLTINTAAKVANCIYDNLITNMIYRAMTAGKPIVAAVDGCCPDNEVRQKLGFKVTDAYKQRLRKNLEDLQAYGIILTVDQKLREKVDRVHCASFDFPIPSSDSKMETGGSKKIATEIAKQQNFDASLKLDKKVIGRVDIATNARYKTIIVREDAVVTGLAVDEAMNRGIRIVKE